MCVYVLFLMLLQEKSDWCAKSVCLFAIRCHNPKE